MRSPLVRSSDMFASGLVSKTRVRIARAPLRVLCTHRGVFGHNA